MGFGISTKPRDRNTLNNSSLSGFIKEEVLARKTILGVLVVVPIFLGSITIGAALGKWTVDRELVSSPPAAESSGMSPRLADALAFGEGGALEPPAGDSVANDFDLGAELPAPDLKRYRYTITENDSFYNALKCFNVPHEVIMKWCEVAKPEYNLTMIRPGQSLCLYASNKDDKEEFVRLELKINDTENLVISKYDDGFKAEIGAPDESSEVFTSESDREFQAVPAWVSPSSGLRYYRGTVKTNFYDSAIEAGITPSKAMEMIHAFGGVNFGRDIREGDRFSMLVAPGKNAGEEGPILAAMVETGGKANHVYRFEDNGKSGYFDQDGKSSRNKRLVCPVRYTRISSGYSNHRFHPVLKKYRPHLGVDYAAPVGTPVKAAASGTVISTGWKNGYGRTIKIRHDQTFITQYAHLSRYARGIGKGSRVRQGQVIGYVGSSGISTGPHLDYRVYKDGKPVNPLKVTAMPGPPVKDTENFNKLKALLSAELSRPLPLGPPRPWQKQPDPAVAKAEGN